MRHRNQHLARRGSILSAAALSLTVIVSGAPLSADGAPVPPASSAKTISVNDRGALHLVSKHGFTLNERGTASGTIPGPIAVQLKIVSTSRVTAEVTISPSGGSISGYGNGSYHKGETATSFSGSLSINHGSGRYVHAQGSGLSFSGTIARSNEAIAVHVSGRLSD